MRIDQAPISYTVTWEAIVALTWPKSSRARTPCCHYGYTVTEVIEDLEVEARSSAGVRPRQMFGRAQMSSQPKASC
jgi:hypothetical protein